MPDDAEWCCGAGVCCNETKRRVKLAELLKQAVPHLSQQEATDAADFFHDHFDLLPKSLGFGPAFHKLADLARETEYS